MTDSTTFEIGRFMVQFCAKRQIPCLCACQTLYFQMLDETMPSAMKVACNMEMSMSVMYVTAFVSCYMV